MTDSAAPLEVQGMHGGEASLGHGDRCVSLVIENNIGVCAGLVLTPDNARALARSLVRQADHAEDFNG